MVKNYHYYKKCKYGQNDRKWQKWAIMVKIGPILVKNGQNGQQQKMGHRT